MNEVERRERLRAKRVAAILGSQQSMIAKVRQIIALGYDEEEAERLVEQSQINIGQPVYYEQLPQAPYDNERL